MQVTVGRAGPGGLGSLPPAPLTVTPQTTPCPSLRTGLSQAITGDLNIYELELLIYNRLTVLTKIIE